MTNGPDKKTRTDQQPSAETNEADTGIAPYDDETLQAPEIPADAQRTIYLLSLYYMSKDPEILTELLPELVTHPVHNIMIAIGYLWDLHDPCRAQIESVVRRMINSISLSDSKASYGSEENTRTRETDIPIQEAILSVVKYSDSVKNYNPEHDKEYRLQCLLSAFTIQMSEQEIKYSKKLLMMYHGGLEDDEVHFFANLFRIKELLLLIDQNDRSDTYKDEHKSCRKAMEDMQTPPEEIIGHLNDILKKLEEGNRVANLET